MEQAVGNPFWGSPKREVTIFPVATEAINTDLPTSKNGLAP